jgi:hypothetical protein
LATIRLTDAEKRQIQERASEAGLTQAGWVRRAVKDYREMLTKANGRP